MKTRFVLAVIFAVGALVCGCGKEADFAGGDGSGDKDGKGNGNDTPELHYVTVSAGTEAQGDGGASTKAVAYEVGGGVYWQKQDSIGVAIAGSGTFSPLALQSGSGTGSATFGGEIEGEVGGYAVYPYNEGHRISGDTLTFHLPSSYTYSGVDQKCAGTTDGITADKAINSANPPLVARLSKNEAGGVLSADFKHLGGVLRIKVDKFIASTDFFLTVTADKPICGDFKVNLADLSDNYTPSISSSDEPDSSNPDNNTVTIHFHGTSGQSGVFYIPLPACHEEDGGYNLTVKLGYLSLLKLEMSSCTATKHLSVDRKQYKRVNITQATMYKGGYKVINGHKFIDLGLPSGILWAETNLGAELPADFGDYYAWGKTKTDRCYDTETYPATDTLYVYTDTRDFVFTFAKYNSGKSEMTLESGDDAAVQNWGGCWTPTKGAVEELIKYTDYKEASRENSDGVTINGYEFTSKAENNTNSIFLPYNGRKQSVYHDYYSGYDGSYHNGYYWTNALVPDVYKEGGWFTDEGWWYTDDKYDYGLAANLLFGDHEEIKVSTYQRFYGIGVRPVANP